MSAMPRPRKRVIASAAPVGAPSANPTAVAVRLTLSDSSTMPTKSGSSRTIKSSARAKARPRSSMPPVTTPEAEVRAASIENRNQGRDDRVNEPHVQGDADGADDETRDHHEAIPLHKAETEEADGEAERNLPDDRGGDDQPQSQR